MIYALIPIPIIRIRCLHKEFANMVVGGFRLTNTWKYNPVEDQV